MAETAQRPPDEISIQQAASLLELTPQRITQLVRDGYIQRHRQGFTSIRSAVRGYVRALKDAQSRSTQEGAAERARDARAREIEQKIAERDRRLIPTEEAELVMDLLVGAVAKELDGMAARITRDMAFRRLIEADVHGAKIRIADALQEGKGLARTGRDALEAGGEG